MLYLAGERTAPEEVAMSDFDEAQRKAEQFAIYWYGERATLTRMEQHDPIALTPLAPSEPLEPLEPTAGDAPASDEQGGMPTPGRLSSILRKALPCASPSCGRPQAGMASR
jgi:hypothetical protein